MRSFNISFITGGKRSLKRPRPRWKENIKVNLKDLKRFDRALSLVAGCCEFSDVP
jgi:hypothetical protein